MSALAKDKIALHRHIASFVEQYLVIAQDRRITLESIGCTLRKCDLFDKVELSHPRPDSGADS